MKQSFVLAVLVTLMALASPTAYAIGLGPPAVHSYLHAPLNVSIPLVDAGQNDPDKVRVSVADRAAFRAAGLEWQDLAESVKATIHAGSESLEVRLTSSAPASTPWLDLLLTLTTPDGDVSQDVTLLFEPPVYAKKGETTLGAAGLEAARLVVEGRQVPSPTIQVKSGDTLWNAAERVRPAPATLEQVMLALVAANPRAFPSGNINGLSAGQDLSVPTADQMLSRSKGQAAQTIDYMNTAWRIRGPNGPVHVPLGPSSPQPPAPDDTAAAQDAAADLSSRALLAARRLGEGAAADRQAQAKKQTRLERITRQRDRLREEVSALKTEISQLADELALQEVELARQEVRMPLSDLRDEEGNGTADEPGEGSSDEAQESAATPPPASEMEIARRGMVAIATEYRWPLAGVALLLLMLLAGWRLRRRQAGRPGDPPASAPPGASEDDAMLGRSQAAGLAASRGEARNDSQEGEPPRVEKVAIRPPSQDNVRSSP
ncbi:MAG: hypothetical protein L0I84_01580 [Halomonas subglaciescola]|nr:hypothetical protein [Halomonas subglaciescola]